MAKTETIAKVKTALRINHSLLDGEIADIIDACLLDLEALVGVREPDQEDPLILAAIKLYARAQFCDNTADAAAFLARYADMKGSLQMAGGYGGAQ